jgi:hypothetical protein
MSEIFDKNKCYAIDDESKVDDDVQVCCTPAPECSICLESIGSTAIFVTKCKHIFHKGCINKWCKTTNSCPLCRTEKIIDMPGPKYISYMDNIIMDNIIMDNIIMDNNTSSIQDRNQNNFNQIVWLIDAGQYDAANDYINNINNINNINSNNYNLNYFIIDN